MLNGVIVRKLQSLDKILTELRSYCLTLSNLEMKYWPMSKKIDWDRTQSVGKTTSEVIAAWAFGSAQDGHVRAGSDIDIGVLMKSPPSLDEQLELVAALESALRIGNVDLVILNEVNPILRFEAISGRAIYCSDMGRRAEFASLTAREYEDEMALWERTLESRG
jgi:predicted nucleotidyltransferase